LKKRREKMRILLKTNITQDQNENITQDQKYIGEYYSRPRVSNPAGVEVFEAMRSVVNLTVLKV
jgi:hypothetical protein